MFEKIKKFILFFSVVFLIAGITCFTAYNWKDMSSIQKLGVPASLIITGLIAYFLLKKEIYQNLALFFSSFMIGTLFAVFGQVYQTGADAWTLFRNWAFFLSIPLLVSKFYPLGILLTLVTSIGASLWGNLIYSPSTALFLGLIPMILVLIVYPLVIKIIKADFNNYFYNIICLVFYPYFISFGIAAIFSNNSYEMLAYILIGGTIYLIGYKFLKKTIVLLLSIMATSSFIQGLVIKIGLKSTYLDFTFVILIIFGIFVGTIIALVKTFPSTESEALKKFMYFLVSGHKILTIISLLVFVATLLSLLGLGESALIIVGIFLLIASVILPKKLGLKYSKIEIISFIAGLISIWIYLTFALDLSPFVATLIIALIFDVFFYYFRVKILRILLLPIHFLVIEAFLFNKFRYSFTEDFILALALVVLLIYQIFNKKLKADILVEKFQDIILGNELILMSLAIFWQFNMRKYNLIEFQDSIKIYFYFNTALILINLFFPIFLCIKNRINQLVSVIILAVIVYFNLKTDGANLVLMLLILYISRNDKWKTYLLTLIFGYIVASFYFSTETTLLEKSISLCSSGVFLLVSYIVFKFLPQQKEGELNEIC